MKKKDNMARYSPGEQSMGDLSGVAVRGEGRTDWARATSLPEEELERSIAADPDDVHEQIDWNKAIIGLPSLKKHINIRVDTDVLDWFRSQGRGYQTMMNNVLRAFVDSRSHGPRGEGR